MVGDNVALTHVSDMGTWLHMGLLLLNVELTKTLKAKRFVGLLTLEKIYPINIIFLVLELWFNFNFYCTNLKCCNFIRTNYNNKFFTMKNTQFIMK